ncbi:DedA family protein [Lactobacillus delbrueckii]|uniref:DedA family protein n=1 Tax=Lactobacillus delbrueckii TaxID=1584 RepID=UPI00272C1654|nr:DedA family protein [Lactobacillus delbrueckii]WKZ99252.1 DedA family protein [Lactobacillus delbrueckii]
MIASTIGAFISAVTLYWVGTFFDQDRLSRFAASKVGRRFGLSPEKITKTENYFNSHGRPATFFGRFIPVVRSLISLPAGMSRFSLARFSFYTILGHGNLEHGLDLRRPLCRQCLPASGPGI